MSALANHAFVKMNGIGNEIVVVDMRAGGEKVTADDARAVAAPEGAPYDQLMVLYPPRAGGTGMKKFESSGGGLLPRCAKRVRAPSSAFRPHGVAGDLHGACDLPRGNVAAARDHPLAPAAVEI